MPSSRVSKKNSQMDDQQTVSNKANCRESSKEYSSRRKKHCKKTEDGGKCEICVHGRQKCRKRRCIEAISKMEQENAPMRPHTSQTPIKPKKRAFILQMSNHFIDTCSNLQFGGHKEIAGANFRRLAVDKDYDKVTVVLEDDADIFATESTDEITKDFLDICCQGDAFGGSTDKNQDTTDVGDGLGYSACDVPGSASAHSSVNLVSEEADHIHDFKVDLEDLTTSMKRPEAIDFVEKESDHKESEIKSDNEETSYEKETESSYDDILERVKIKFEENEVFATSIDDEDKDMDYSSETECNKGKNEKIEGESKTLEIQNKNHIYNIKICCPLCKKKSWYVYYRQGILQHVRTKHKYKFQEIKEKLAQEVSCYANKKLNDDEDMETCPICLKSVQQTFFPLHIQWAHLEYHKLETQLALEKCYTEFMISNKPLTMKTTVHQFKLKFESVEDKKFWSEIKSEQCICGFYKSRKSVMLKHRLRCKKYQKHNHAKTVKDADLSNEYSKYSKRNKKQTKVLSGKVIPVKIRSQFEAIDSDDNEGSDEDYWPESDDGNQADEVENRALEIQEKSYVYNVKVCCPLCKDNSWQLYSRSNISTHLGMKHENRLQEIRDKLAQEVSSCTTKQLDNNERTENCSICLENIPQTFLPLHIQWDHFESDKSEAQFALEKCYTSFMASNKPLTMKTTLNQFKLKFEKVSYNANKDEPFWSNMKEAFHCRCGFVTTKRSVLSRHKSFCKQNLDEIEGTLNVQILCPICEKWFPCSKGSIVAHYQLEHPSQKEPFIAQIEEEISLENRDENCEDAKAACVICEELVAESSMMMHIYWVHSEQKPTEAQAALKNSYEEVIKSELPLKTLTPKYGLQLAFEKLPSITTTNVNSVTSAIHHKVKVKSPMLLDTNSKISNCHSVKIRCPVCDDWYRYYRSSIVSHLVKQHDRLDIVSQIKKEVENLHDIPEIRDDENLATCELCGKKTFREYMPVHIQWSHLDKKYEKSKALLELYYNQRVDAGEKLQYKTNLFKFDLSFQRGPKKLICEVCEFCNGEFTKSKIQSHRSRCKQNPNRMRKFYCNCRFTTYVEKDFLEHKKDCTPQVFCEYCGKDCKNKPNYYKHRKFVHGIVTEKTTPIQQYKCDVCGKEFHLPSVLKAHRMTHFDKKDYVCHYCAKSYRFSHLLKRHVEYVHLNIVRHRCDKCGHPVEKKDRLKRHRCGVTRKRRSSYQVNLDKFMNQEISSEKTPQKSQHKLQTAEKATSNDIPITVEVIPAEFTMNFPKDGGVENWQMDAPIHHGVSSLVQEEHSNAQIFNHAIASALQCNSTATVQRSHNQTAATAAFIL